MTSQLGYMESPYDESSFNYFLNEYYKWIEGHQKALCFPSFDDAKAHFERRINFQDGGQEISISHKTLFEIWYIWNYFSGKNNLPRWAMEVYQNVRGISFTLFGCDPIRNPELFVFETFERVQKNLDSLLENINGTIVNLSALTQGIQYE